MKALIFEFFDSRLGAVAALLIYGGCFYLLSKIAEDPDKASPCSLKAAHSDRRFFHKDFKLELGYFFLNTFVTDLLGKLLVVFLTLYVLVPFIPYQFFADFIQSQPFWVQLPVGLLIADAAFFFPHWFAHRFLWPYHSIHHSAKELRWITALRLHPVDHLSFVIGGALALHLFGFEGQSIIYAILIHSAYNLFVHANLNLDYPRPLCYVLGSPNYHRWHHAADKKAIDKNFATMFPLFDLIFGSYYHPRGKLPKSYGLYAPGKQKKEPPSNLLQQLLYPFKRRK